MSLKVDNRFQQRWEHLLDSALSDKQIASVLNATRQPAYAFSLSRDKAVFSCLIGAPLTRKQMLSLDFSQWTGAGFADVCTGPDHQREISLLAFTLPILGISQQRYVKFHRMAFSKATQIFSSEKWPKTPLQCGLKSLVFSGGYNARNCLA